MTKKEYLIISKFISTFHIDFAVSSDERLSPRLVSDFMDIERLVLDSIHEKRHNENMWRRV